MNSSRHKVSRRAKCSAKPHPTLARIAQCACVLLPLSSRRSALHCSHNFHPGSAASPRKTIPGSARPTRGSHQDGSQVVYVVSASIGHRTAGSVGVDCVDRRRARATRPSRRVGRRARLAGRRTASIAFIRRTPRAHGIAGRRDLRLRATLGRHDVVRLTAARHDGSQRPVELRVVAERCAVDLPVAYGPERCVAGRKRAKRRATLYAKLIQVQ
jgi:hypothetical protein